MNFCEWRGREFRSGRHEKRSWPWNFLDARDDDLFESEEESKSDEESESEERKDEIEDEESE